MTALCSQTDPASSIKWARAVFVLLLVLVPVTDAGHLTISVFLGFSWLATVPPTTSLTASILGTRWLGTIVGIEFAAHQVGGFLGTYLGAVEYDRTGGYTVCWIITIVLAAIAGTFVAFAGDRTLRRKEIDSFGDDYVKLGGNEDNLEGGKAEEARSG